MIEVSGKKRTVRECTAEFEKDDGTTETITVRYFDRTLVEMKAAMAAAEKLRSKKKDVTVEDFPWVSDQLAKQLESLPDLTLEGGNPFEITAANLDLLTARNLRAIEAAIEDDSRPKSLQPS